MITDWRQLLRRTGELCIAPDRGVPRSTARAWLGASPTAVVSLHGLDLTEPELRQEILTLQRRVDKLAALVRLALALRPKLRARNYNLVELGPREPVRVTCARNSVRAPTALYATFIDLLCGGRYIQQYNPAVKPFPRTYADPSRRIA
jgi:hypothetical protein